MYSIELLIFDLDGTLCDTRDDIAISVNLTLRELGLPEKPVDAIYSYVGSGVRSLLQQAVGEQSDDRLREAMRIFRAHYLEHLLDTTRPYSGIVDILDRFKKKKKAVVTNKPQEYTDRILRGLDLTNHFNLIVGGENGLLLKPEPHMILSVLNQLQAEKAKCVMIGDGLHDIAAARAAGIKVCAVGYGLGDSRELLKAGPDFFCKQPEEMIQFFE